MPTAATWAARPAAAETTGIRRPPRFAATCPRPPVHSGPAGPRGVVAAVAPADAATESPPCGDSPSPHTPHPTAGPSSAAPRAPSVPASVPDTRELLVVPLGFSPSPSSLMGNPSCGATIGRPVTLSMARYDSLTPTNFSGKVPAGERTFIRRRVFHLRLILQVA